MSAFQKQKLSFLMGMHPRVGARSAVLGCSYNPTYDRNVLKVIFGYKLLELLPNFLWDCKTAIKIEYAKAEQNLSRKLPLNSGFMPLLLTSSCTIALGLVNDNLGLLLFKLGKGWRGPVAPSTD